VDAQGRVLPDEGSGRAGVVEVDVREDEMAEVGNREPALSEGGFERLEARRGPAVDQRGLVPRQQVGRDDPGVAQVEEVEWLDRST
jgi:hypothetical protein